MLTQFPVRGNISDIPVKTKIFIYGSETDLLLGTIFLINEKFWCQAKNLPAILEMKKYPNIHYFWHQEDDITLTSKGYIWAHPGMQPLSNSIAVLPELYNEKVLGCVGVCSDYIKNFENV